MYKLLNRKIEPIKIINENIHNFPFVISIPHSGLYITKQMAINLKSDVILAIQTGISQSYMIF